jgi:hypothetical protein
MGARVGNVVVPRFEALIRLLDNEAWPVDIVSGILIAAAATNLWIGLGACTRSVQLRGRCCIGGKLLMSEE